MPLLDLLHFLFQELNLLLVECLLLVVLTLLVPHLALYLAVGLTLLRRGGVRRGPDRREANLLRGRSIQLVLALKRARVPQSIVIEHGLIMLRLHLLQKVGVVILVFVVHVLRRAQSEWLDLGLIELIEIEVLLGKLRANSQRALPFLTLKLLHPVDVLVLF